MTCRQYKLLWQCVYSFKLTDPSSYWFVYPGFVLLRNRKLYPLFRTLDELPPSRKLPEYRFHWLEENIDFGISYLFEALVSHGTVAPDELEILYRIVRHRSDAALLLQGLSDIMREGSIEEDVRGKNTLQYNKPGQRYAEVFLVVVAQSLTYKSKPQPHCMIVRHCLVTPHRLILQPPQTEASNSMLRAFAAHCDRFLRVKFVNEEGDFPVSHETITIDNNIGPNSGVFARIRRTLDFGVRIGGRHYVFLTYGESQVKYVGFPIVSFDSKFWTYTGKMAAGWYLKQTASRFQLFWAGWAIYRRKELWLNMQHGKAWWRIT